jgi:Trypsin
MHQSAFWAVALLSCVLIERAETAELQMLDHNIIKSSDAAAIEGQVIGGMKAQLGEWPATFAFVLSNNKPGCTANAVSDRVILTAAHCVLTITGAVVTNGKTYDLNCDVHPDYPRDISADFALCRTFEGLPASEKGFERINIDSSALKAGDAIFLLGYGCTSDNGVRDFGNLIIGKSILQPAETKSMYALGHGGAVGCAGDSGGGAFRIIGSGNLATNRVLIGVTSQGDMRSNTWFSLTSSPSFVSWANEWAARFSLQICGITSEAAPCRAGI